MQFPERLQNFSVTFMKSWHENKRGGNDYKSVLEILNIYQAVGDMHFIGERDYFNKIEKKLEKELETDGSLWNLKQQ